MQSDPHLTVEDGSRALDLDQTRGHNEQRQGQEKEGEGHRDVQLTLQELVDRTPTKTVRVEQPAWLECVEIDSPGLALPKIEEIGHLDAAEFAMQQLADW